MVVHEVVRWPGARVPRAGDGVGGKFLYGLLFVAVLPALLVGWARRTEAVVRAPAWHDERLGAALAATGAITMIAGWLALWRQGGGLPINAFPPPRLATRGIYAVLAHPIDMGFVAICFGVSLATGSASGLWLVSPSIALGSVALVRGYESHDLDDRFGLSRPRPWLARRTHQALRALGSEALLAQAWRPMRFMAERTANSWYELRAGPVRIINHGVWAALATIGGVAGLGFLLAPGHTDAILFAGAAKA